MGAIQIHTVERKYGSYLPLLPLFWFLRLLLALMIINFQCFIVFLLAIRTQVLNTFSEWDESILFLLRKRHKLQIVDIQIAILRILYLQN